MQVTDYSALRLLAIGAGSIGMRHTEVLLGLGATNLCVCEPSDTQRAKLQEKFPQVRVAADYKEELSKGCYDAAFIFTPTAMHLSMATEAIEAGCHVFIEKPLANTSEGVDELAALAAKHNKLVMVGFCMRFHEVLKKAKALVDEGFVGRLVNIRAFVGEPFAEIQPNYMNMYYSKYSGAFELVHDLDLALWLSQQKVKEVYGVYGPFSDMGMESPDSVELLLKMEDRMGINVHLDFYHHPRRRQIDLMGVKGTITVEFASWDEATLSCYNTDTRAWERTTFPTRRNDMFRDENAEFLDAVLGKGQISCTIEEALRSLHVIESVYKP